MGCHVWGIKLFLNDPMFGYQICSEDSSVSW